MPYCVMCGEYVAEGSMVCKNCRDTKPNFDTTKAFDYVEVIRCENCKHFTGAELHFCRRFGIYTEPDFYCGGAKKY